MSPPSPATAGRTRVSSSSLIWSTTSWSAGSTSSSDQVVIVTVDHRQAGDEMVHDGAQHPWLQRLPGNLVGPGDGDEVGAQENAADAFQAEQRGCQRAAGGDCGGGEVGRAEVHDVPPRQEFQRGRVWGAFGFDEHDEPILDVVKSGPLRSGFLRGIHRSNQRLWQDGRVHRMCFSWDNGSSPTR